MKDQCVPCRLEEKIVRMGFDRNKRLRFTNSTGSVTGILWQQAFDWFREEHSLPSWVYGDGVVWDFKIVKGDYWITQDAVPFFKTYKEARLACLEKLIELCKNN